MRFFLIKLNKPVKILQKLPMAPSSNQIYNRMQMHQSSYTKTLVFLTYANQDVLENQQRLCIICTAVLMVIFIEKKNVYCTRVNTVRSVRNNKLCTIKFEIFFHEKFCCVLVCMSFLGSYHKALQGALVLVTRVTRQQLFYLIRNVRGRSQSEANIFKRCDSFSKVICQ